MSVATRIQGTELTVPMQHAALHISPEITPVTATPVIAATSALVGAFAAGFAVGQASARG